MHAELPPVVTYKGSELMRDMESGYWRLFFTEHAARVAAWVLWDVYDTFRLWYVPRRVRAAIRQLNLQYLLGAASNERELHRLLSVIESVDWQTAEFVYTTYGCASLEDPRELAPGDFICYDPWSHRRISVE